MSDHCDKQTTAESSTDNGKWVDLQGASLQGASACLSSAARITLQTRLASVQEYLPLAALQADETPEHVHRLRVSTRRVLAALRLYKKLLPRRQTEKMRALMKQIRKAVGIARDLDVLSERYEQSDSKQHKRLLRKLRRARRKGQHAILELNRDLVESNKLAKRTTKLLASVRCRTDKTLMQFAVCHVQKQADRFFQCASSDLSQVHQLHRFRIQAKEFRYTIELLHDVLPGEVRRDIYPIVCRTQDVLGELNDHSIASQRFKRLAQKEKRRRAAKRYRKLCREEKQRMETARKLFDRWWTPKFTQEVHGMLTAVLGDCQP